MAFLTKCSTVLWLSICLVLTACGGGGGGGSSDPNPPSSDSGGDNTDGDTGGDGSNDDGGDGSGDGNGADDDSNDGDSGSGDHDHGDMDTGAPADNTSHVGEVRESEPELDISATPQQLHFSWETYGDDDHYHLWEYQDGGVRQELDVFAGYSSRTIDVVTHRHPWQEINYMVSACAADFDCYESGFIDVTEEMMLGAIGYFKPFGDAATEAFGTSVAVSEDGQTLAVGSAGTDNAGGVFIYNRTDEAWETTAQIMAESAAGFGSSLTLSSNGETLVIGAPRENTDTGAVYVATSENWENTTRVALPEGSEGDAFGFAVSLSADGTRFAAGAPGADGETGRVHVFTLSGDTWSEAFAATASNAEAGDRFGASVALSLNGQLLAVGAPAEDSAGDQADNSAENAGAVYLFADNGDQQAYVKGPNPAAGARFGAAVAVDEEGNRVAVGETGAEGTAGSAYVLRDEGTGWAAIETLNASNPASVAGDFGSSIAISADGSFVVVGAPGTDSDAVGINNTQSGGAPAAGAVYSFAESDEDATWAQEAFIKASNTDAEDRFGASLALGRNGDALAVGAIGEDSAASGIGGDLEDNTAEGTGAAYLY